MLLQLLFILLAIIIGARIQGIGLGVMGGLGLAILVFGFGLEPTSPPIDVMLMIVAVISAAGCMQAAGGLDLMVALAEKLLRKHPSRITILSPIVTYFFTFIAGTGHVVYSVLPVIAEVARETKVRPERPLAIAVIASQQAITASPISAATVALLGLLTGYNISLLDILMVSVPSTLCGVILGAVFSMKKGKELEEDPEYQRRIETGFFNEDKSKLLSKVKIRSKAGLSVLVFILATLLIILFGSIDKLREMNGFKIEMPVIIEVVMLSAAAFILLFTKTNGIKAAQGSVFVSGMQAVVAIFGIAWMGDTFINGNMNELKSSIEDVVNAFPWVFGLAMFIMSILLYSQAATIRAIIPLGIVLGISPWILIALFPTVNGYFFLPNYPTVVAAINFDRTGTTGIGKWILNHSFMLPGLIATAGAVCVGFLIITVAGLL